VIPPDCARAGTADRANTVKAAATTLEVDVPEQDNLLNVPQLQGKSQSPAGHTGTVSVLPIAHGLWTVD